MCDYSLHAVQNRLAVEGERLIVHRFNSGSIGLAAAPCESETAAPKSMLGFWRKFFMMDANFNSLECAVCIPPGARLVLYDIPSRLQREFGIHETENVTFTELSADEYAYRDAVEFHSGKSVLLQRLKPGQKVTVVTLSGADDRAVDPVLEDIAA